MYNNVNVLNAFEPYTENGYDGKFHVIHVLPQTNYLDLLI